MNKENKLLGRPLSRMELIVYTAILGSGKTPISGEELQKQVFSGGFGINEGGTLENIYSVVGRIREKLGDTSIITGENGGYLARSAVIDSQVRQGIKDAWNEWVDGDQ